MEFPFSDYIALLEQFLAGRQTIVEGLERQLFSARGNATAESRDRESVADIFDSCFFDSPTISPHLSSLKGRLDAAHRADGFEPAPGDGYSRELDPVELVLRACYHWRRDRWPGRNGRLGYTQGLYAAFILRQLERLTLRIWDEGPKRPSSIVDRSSSNNDQVIARLQQVQRLLDALNEGGRSPQGLRLIGDARWLIQTAQGPLTQHVKPYFIKAGQVARSFADVDRIEIHKAGVVLAGGHLRSQLRHLSRRTGWAFDDPQLLALTRSSNSMDMALLVRDLVPLLDAYSAACVRQDDDLRLVLADAILQGLSSDPELLLTRVDLLRPSTMIESLFVDPVAAGASPHTALGAVHADCLARYSELIGRTAESLRHDNLALDPAHSPYSPLGIVYGFCADFFANMVLHTLVSSSWPDLSLEDMFVTSRRLEEKQTLAREWERLPKREGEPDPFEHSTEWAVRMFARLSDALELRATRPAEPNASLLPPCRLYVVPPRLAIDAASDGVLPLGIVSAQEHCLTSDVTRARATGATFLPAERLIADRAEGRLLACAHSGDAWFGISKVPLTLYMSRGKHALLTDVPSGVIDLLRLTCLELLFVIGEPSSTPEIAERKG